MWMEGPVDRQQGRDGRRAALTAARRTPCFAAGCGSASVPTDLCSPAAASVPRTMTKAMVGLLKGQLCIPLCHGLFAEGQLCIALVYGLFAASEAVVSRACAMRPNFLPPPCLPPPSIRGHRRRLRLPPGAARAHPAAHAGALRRPGERCGARLAPAPCHAVLQGSLGTVLCVPRWPAAAACTCCRAHLSPACCQWPAGPGAERGAAAHGAAALRRPGRGPVHPRPLGAPGQLPWRVHPARHPSVSCTCLLPLPLPLPLPLLLLAGWLTGFMHAVCGNTATPCKNASCHHTPAAFRWPPCPLCAGSSSRWWRRTPSASAARWPTRRPCTPTWERVRWPRCVPLRWWGALLRGCRAPRSRAGGRSRREGLHTSHALALTLLPPAARPCDN